MHFYRLCDFVFSSDIELPELEEAAPEAVAYSFYLQRPCAMGKVSSHRLSHQSDLSEEAWPFVFLQGASQWLSFSGLADFEFVAAAQAIRCYPQTEVPLVTIRHLLVDQVMPILTSCQSGRLVLHASSISLNEEAIVFLGASGLGKSSLAGSFCQSGSPLLTDDFLLVEQKAGIFCGSPSYPALRLWPEALSAVMQPQAEARQMAHYSEKKWLSLRQAKLPFAYRTIPLKQLYLLAPGGSMKNEPAVQIEPVALPEAILELTQCLFRLDPHDKEKYREEFLLLGQMVSSVQVFRLSYSRSFEFLPTVREAILKNLDNHTKQISNASLTGKYV